MPCRYLFLLICAFLVAMRAAAGDWPEFRGATAQGLYNGKPLPTAWGPDKNIAWRKPIEGLGWSTPAIAGGRVYLTTALPQGDDWSLRAQCLDAASGKPVWEKEVFVEDGQTSPKIYSKN